MQWASCNHLKASLAITTMDAERDAIKYQKYVSSSHVGVFLLDIFKQNNATHYKQYISSS